MSVKGVKMAKRNSCLAQEWSWKREKQKQVRLLQIMVICEGSVIPNDASLKQLSWKKLLFFLKGNTNTHAHMNKDDFEPRCKLDYQITESWLLLVD